MKIGIMTWFTYHNYGTALQLTALSEKIKSLGHEPIVINYDPDSISALRERGTSLSFFTIVKAFFKSLLKRIKLFVHVKSVINFLRSGYSPYSSVKREKKFEIFLHSCISFTHECNTVQKLQNIAYKFDAVICGSDQIWSPLCLNTRYFLDFVNPSSKKIAYAPSIDTNHVKNEHIKKQIIDMIRDFQSIAVREEQSAETLSQWLNKEIKMVLDPTLLFNAKEWEKYIFNNSCCELYEHRFVKKRYCLAYMLCHNSKYWDEIYNISDRLCLEIKIIPTFTDDFLRNGCIKYPVGPVEFLSLFKNAEFICTDSFHGMVFSIIFHVNFIEFMRFERDDPINQNFRIFNIANLLSLKDRLSNGQVPDRLIKSAINFHEVDRKLNALREDSLNWLKGALTLVEEK